jgi:outer membrane protein assembly factor BamD (BamD/ComL family)
MFRGKSLISVLPAAFVVFAIGFGAALTNVALPSKIMWEHDYEKAIERAQRENKLIIADMFTDWCELCKELDQQTFAERHLIQKMANAYVWLKLNTETEDDGIRLQKEFAIFTYPTVLVLDSHGEEVDRVTRFLTATPFRETVESFIDNPDSLANLRKTVREQPNLISARYALAEKLLDRNNYARAAQEFEKVIELDPENRERKTDLSQYNLALCLASQEKFVEAITQLDTLESRFPSSTAIAYSKVLRGQIYRCCNKLDEAQAVLREYMQKYPTQGHIQEVENLLAAMEAETKGK